MKIIKDTDLFVVNRGNGVYNYSGKQLGEDIAEALASRDVKIWIQEEPPFTGPPDNASRRDLWYDTTIGAFFIGQISDSGDIVWVIVNPADHRNFLETGTGEVTFPEASSQDLEFVHPTTGITYYCKPLKNQWVDKDLPGLDTFVLKEGDTMTGALQLPNLIVTGDDTVEAHIELNEGILTADDSVVGEEQRLYWNGDTVAKHEDVVTLTNAVVNIDQHIENITPYAFRGLLRNNTSQDSESYVFYDSVGDVTSNIENVEKVFLSDTGVGIDGIDVNEITNGMYLEVQRVDATDVLTGKIIEKSNVTGGAEFNLDVTRAQGTATVGDISHIRIFSVADSSAKAGVYYQPLAPDEDVELLKPGQLWVDSSTNIQYIWTGEEWTEVGAACGSGGSSTQIPVGTIWPYAGNIDSQTPVPRGWLLCDGSTIDGRYVRLKELLGVETVPDLRGKYLGGAGDLGLDGVRSEKTDFTRNPRMTDVDYNGNNNKLINISVNNTNLGNHYHGVGNISASTSGKDGTHGHGFAVASYNKTGGTNAVRNEEGNAFNISGQGAHNHAITMSGNTANDNLGEHKHGVNVNWRDWDEYTRPYTYVVHWIIKHD